MPSERNLHTPQLRFLESAPPREAAANDEPDRRIKILQSALRILCDSPRLGDSYQRAEWKRMIEQDRAALRGYGVLA